MHPLSGQLLWLALLLLSPCLVVLSSSPTPAVTLLGGGSSLAAPLYQSAILAYSLQEPSVSLSYTSSSSGSGRAALLSGAYDFADSDSVLPASFWAVQPDSLCLPVLAAAVVPIFNVPGLVDLQLTQAALAGMFMGAVTHWNDSSIVASNPGVELPYQPITVVTRSDSSGTTHIFTAALAAFSPAFNQSVGSAELVTWPIAAGYLLAASGNTGVANLVASTPYAIGYSVLNEAIYRQLTFASVQNAAGSFVVASPATVQYALYERAVLTLGLSSTDILPGPSGNGVSLVNPAAPRAYPISGFSYLIVFTNVSRANQTCQARTALVQFILYFIYSEVVATIAAQSQFNSLPQLLQQALDMQDVIASSLRCVDGSLAYVQESTITQSLVSGSGSPSVQPFFDFYTAAYAFVDQSDSFQFDATSTADAVQEVAVQRSELGVASFGVVLGTQLSSSELQAIESYALQLLPLALLPVVPVFHLPNITALVLTVAAVGSMYSGAITQWNDAAIQSLNPKLTLPALPIILTAVSPTNSASVGNASLEATSIFVDTLFRLSPAFSACYSTSSNSSTVSQFVFASAVQNGCSSYAGARWLYASSEASLQSVVVNTVGAIGYTLTSFSIQASTVHLVSPSDTTLVNASLPISYNISQLTTCLSDGGFSVSSSSDALQVAPASSASKQCWPFVSVVSLLVNPAHNSAAAGTTSAAAPVCDQAAHLLAFFQYLYSPAASSVLTSSAHSAGLALVSEWNTTTVSAQLTAYLASTWTCNGDLLIVTPPAPVVWSLAPYIRISGEVISAVGYGCTLTAMALVWRHRRQTIYKVASPVFICLSLTGLLCLYTAIVLLVQPVSAGVCSGFNWAANLGCTLTLAPLLVKTWRVHKIFNRRKMRVIKITNAKLLSVVGVLLGMELTLLVAWQSVAPMTIATSVQQLSAEHQYTQCTYSGASVDFFVAAALCKGLMLAAGVLMAFSTRDVAQQFNESKSIAISLYNIVIVIALVAPTIVFISAVGDTRVALLLFLLAWASSFTLATLMLPKVLDVLRSRYQVADAPHSMNHTMSREDASDGSMAGGLFDFPSLSGLSSRRTLLQYVTMLEQHHSAAKKKLLSLKEQPLYSGEGALSASPTAAPSQRLVQTVSPRAARSPQSRMHSSAELASQSQPAVSIASSHSTAAAATSAKGDQAERTEGVVRSVASPKHVNALPPTSALVSSTQSRAGSLMADAASSLPLTVLVAHSALIKRHVIV